MNRLTSVTSRLGWMEYKMCGWTVEHIEKLIILSEPGMMISERNASASEKFGIWIMHTLINPINVESVPNLMMLWEGLYTSKKNGSTNTNSYNWYHGVVTYSTPRSWGPVYPLYWRVRCWKDWKHKEGELFNHSVTMKKNLCALSRLSNISLMWLPRSPRALRTPPPR